MGSALSYCLQLGKPQVKKLISDKRSRVQMQTQYKYQQAHQQIQAAYKRLTEPGLVRNDPAVRLQEIHHVSNTTLLNHHDNHKANAGNQCMESSFLKRSCTQNDFSNSERKIKAADHFGIKNEFIKIRIDDAQIYGLLYEEIFLPKDR